jgi:hypothetical protein
MRDIEQDDGHMCLNRNRGGTQESGELQLCAVRVTYWPEGDAALINPLKRGSFYCGWIHRLCYKLPNGRTTWLESLRQTLRYLTKNPGVL